MAKNSNNDLDEYYRNNEFIPFLDGTIVYKCSGSDPGTGFREVMPRHQRQGTAFVKLLCIKMKSLIAKNIVTAEVQP